MSYKNKEDEKKYRQAYYKKNKKEIYKKNLKYRKEHRDSYNKASRKSMRKLYEERKELVFDLLGHVCSRCGFDDKRALQIDHINGNGKSDKKKYSSNSHYLKHIISVNGDGYQILCANCNWIKRSERKEHGERIND